jgi:hypothetical protein
MDLLQRLATESDIRQLIGTYAHMVDTRRLDECAELFAEKAVMTVMGQTYDGRAEVRRWLATLDSYGPAGKHMVCNHVFSFGADGSIGAVSDFMVFKDMDARWASTSRGAYHDSFVYANERLLFQRRHIDVIMAKPV